MSRQMSQQMAGMNIGGGRGGPQRGGFGGHRGGQGAPRPSGPPAVAPGTVLSGKSNAFEISIRSRSMAYRYDVEIVKLGTEQRPNKSITKQNDPGLRTAQKECCADIIEALHGLTGGFNVDAHYLYDGKKILFTTKPIESINDRVIEPTELKRKAAMFVRNSQVAVTITPNDQMPSIDCSALNAALVGNVGEQADHTVRTFLEMATTQFLCNSGEYQRVSSGTIFEVQENELADGMSMRVGVKKGVRVTAHGGQAKAYLFADMKRAAFFSTGLLHVAYRQIVRHPSDRETFVRFFRGVRMQVAYDPQRTFIFDSLSARNISDPVYAVNGHSIPQYFRQRMIDLQELDIPGAHPKQPGGQSVVYPLEVIRPVAGQLVPVEKLNEQALRRLLLENAVVPDTRMNYILQHVRRIGEGKGADFLLKFGLCLLLQSNDIQITTSAIPSIQTGIQRLIQPQQNGSWFRDAVGMKFIEGSTKLKNWIVAHDSRVQQNECRDYVRNLRRAASESGMTLPEPLCFESTTLDNMEQVFKKAKDNKVQFILYVDPHFAKSHGKLKLLEAYYKILTQQVVAKNLQAGAQTLKNVIMKTNVKCFGLNYTPIFPPEIKDLSPECKDFLIIGYDIATPPQSTPKERWDLQEAGLKAENRHPSVVGVCANRLKNSGFAGDFFYQQCRTDQVSPNALEKAVQQATAAACANGRRPTRVLVLRDGVSEGRQQKVVENELPAIRRGVQEGLKRTAETANLHPKFTLIVATKEHFKRFFRKAAGGQPGILANTCPGDIVNSKVTRTDVPEFYAQAHHPLKGSPKVPQYAVLVNELSIDPHKLEQAMLLLSNMHQVCACPTSLPLPVYLADETAKRGMEIYNAFLIHRQNGLMSEVSRNDLGMYDFRKLNELLCYVNTPLYGTRFNA